MLDFSKKRVDLVSMERETGIEPALVAWKATVLPLNYSRPGVLRFVLQLFERLLPYDFRRNGGGRWIRTTEGISQQIYSLPPLAAWVSLRHSQIFKIFCTNLAGGG